MFAHLWDTAILLIGDIKYWILGYSIQQAYPTNSVVGRPMQKSTDSSSVLIVFAHPLADSLNGEILKTIANACEEKHIEYHVLDLYKLRDQGKFDPCIGASGMKGRITPDNQNDEKDSAVSGKDQSILEIQKTIESSSNIIFIYPTFWYSMPAILKGFCDRVFSSGWAYTYPQLKGRLINWSGLILSNIPIVRNWFRRYIVLGRLRAKQFSIIRTYGGPVTTSKIFGSTHGLLENGILRFCGASRIKVLEIENTDRSFFNKTEFLKAMQSVRTLIHKSISLKSN